MPSGSRYKDGVSRGRADVLAEHAWARRQAPTDSEAKLWRSVRACQLGTRVRREEVLEGFIVDFFVPAKKLVIEVDGGYHARRRMADARRDAKLERAGYRVLRLEAELVMHDLPKAVSLIMAALSA
jgi:leucyl-tRNA synthetase